MAELWSATIRIYRDRDCNHLLSERADDLPNWKEENDTRFGVAGWATYLRQVEKEYAGKWEAIVIFYINGDGRCFYRDVHFLSKPAKASGTYIPRLYIFDVANRKVAKRIFSGSPTYELNLSDLDRGNLFIVGRDEYLLERIRYVLGENGESYRRVMVILNASPACLTALKFAIDLKRVVWMRGKKDIRLLQRIYAAIPPLIRIGIILQNAERLAKAHKSPSRKEVRLAMNGITQEIEALWKRFEKAFCR